MWQCYITKKVERTSLRAVELDAAAATWLETSESHVWAAQGRFAAESLTSADLTDFLFTVHGSDVVIVPLESRIAIHMEIRITGDQATVEVAPSSAFLRLRVNNQLVDVPISTGAIVCNHPQENFDISEELLVQTQGVDVVVAGSRKVVVNEGHVNVVLYLGLEAQRQAMAVLVVRDGEFGWRAPYCASPAKS
ncbi:hypothetical protein SeLEV6574_g06284 [Synchytrium endobioticum]|uniref:Uncharacterized protein n=1 Tax=Synchytrium endobioticum TaxID=286115 RepID=A0A507CPL8_9FUNG|nr:hypothetical protein SeLEV6574_g06284 [Synchytrium endobioticum]